MEPVSAWGGRGGEVRITEVLQQRRQPAFAEHLLRARHPLWVPHREQAHLDAKTQREPADTRAQLTPGPGFQASRSMPWMATVLQRPTVANSHREATGSPGRPSLPCRRRPHTGRGRGRAVSVPRADVRAQRPALPRACSSAGSGAESGARPDVLGGAEDWGASGIRACALARPGTRVSARGHIPATRVCTRGPGRVV